MIRVDVTVDDVAIRQKEDALVKAPGLMKTAYKRNIGRLRGRVLGRLKVNPGKPHYPIRWKSEKQRRAFFASDGFGGGIPSTRTGKLLASYDVVVIDTNGGGVLSITNSDPKARFVVGDDVQPFHIDTGYVQIADAATDAREEAIVILRETWFTVTDGGVQ